MCVAMKEKFFQEQLLRSEKFFEASIRKTVRNPGFWCIKHRMVALAASFIRYSHCVALRACYAAMLCLYGTIRMVIL